MTKLKLTATPEQLDILMQVVAAETKGKRYTVRDYSDRGVFDRDYRDWEQMYENRWVSYHAYDPKFHADKHRITRKGLLQLYLAREKSEAVADG